MNTDELGREFWGILLFETHIKHLHQLLNAEKYNKSLIEFLDWVVYPDTIPLDSQKVFYTILQNRNRLAQYDERLTFSDYVVEQINYEISIRPLSQEEKELQGITVELLNLKYQNENLKPASFNAIYELFSYRHFSLLLDKYVEKKFISRYRAADYLIFHMERGCEL
ncbi:hypothetical protein QTG56_23120 (plasmid) [Rossellomorea sp. AcN35-11]|nr:hypothetical protein [Rossellomorea aquimaris]WJV32258.1 hypothetical protein QTG56_23120 [Rossellomorea sp. AcN35-11]